MVRLTNAEDAQWQQPFSLTADGEWLFFQQSDAGRSFDIWALNMKSGQPPRAVLDGPEETMYPAISPDGRWLAHTEMGAQGERVFVTDFPGGQGRWEIAANGTAPVWNSNGRELFFEQQTRDGHVAVYAVGSREEVVRGTVCRVHRFWPQL
jgi:Tol biopolymer transport system component